MRSGTLRSAFGRRQEGCRHRAAALRDKGHVVCIALYAATCNVRGIYRSVELGVRFGPQRRHAKSLLRWAQQAPKGGDHAGAEVSKPGLGFDTSAPAAVLIWRPRSGGLHRLLRHHVAHQRAARRTVTITGGSCWITGAFTVTTTGGRL
jgi:hypothetical protein